ncbi:PP2C family protein-serine/threonine phosphatase [Streptomyces sp. NPDC048462]|uniref:PP2C family protein-serine/threonine phosphatase n=1 Tax=Streptomyces sp. NPDC048462 TaxID=3365555 RepID=UPI0037130DDE
MEVPAGNEELRVVNRGHPEPLLLRADGESIRLVPRAFALPLGLGDLAPDLPEADVYAFPPGATLLLYTDGLSEARGPDYVFYDPAARLGGRTFASPDHLLNAVVDDVRRYAAGIRSDDMALLAVGRPARRSSQG